MEKFCKLRKFAPLFASTAPMQALNVKKYLYRPGVFQEVKVPRFHYNGTGWW